MSANIQRMFTHNFYIFAVVISVQAILVERNDVQFKDVFKNSGSFSGLVKPNLTKFAVSLDSVEAEINDCDSVSCRYKRQMYNWKMSNTPPFVTKSKNENSEQPILQIYPLELTRDGRSRDSNPRVGKRIIYYATLPDVVRYPPTSHNDRIVNPRQQHNFDLDLNKKDFVTRVQSSIIGVKPRPEKYETDKAPLIIEPDLKPYDRYNNPGYKLNLLYSNNNVEKTQYQYPYDRVFQYNDYERNRYPPPDHRYTAIRYDNYERIPSYGTNSGHPTNYERIPSYGSNSPQTGNYDRKLSYGSSPYPTRHTRFPTNQIAQSYVDINQASFSATQSPGSINQDHQDYIPELLNPQSSDYGFHGSLEDTPSTFAPLKQQQVFFSTQAPNSFFTGQVHNTFFSPQSGVGQKYLDPPFQDDLKLSTNKFHDDRHEPVKSSVSDWWANKPFDLPPFDMDDISSNDHGYHLKGPHSVTVDTQVTYNSTATNSTSAAINNTIITPYGISKNGFHAESGGNSSRTV